jgi:hypothetical protein
MFQIKVVEKIKTHILYLVTPPPPPPPENRAVYETKWKKIVERGRAQMAIWRMRIACWVPKATDTLRLYSILWIFTTRMVARTPLNVTLYVHCLSFVSSCAQLYKAGVSV